MFAAFPPKYEDLGKQIKDLFNKHYNFGNIKLHFKTDCPNGSKLKVEGTHEMEGSKMVGFVEFKNEFNNDMSVTSKLMSDNTVNTELYLNNRFSPGTKIGVLSTFDPKSGRLGYGFQAEFRNNMMYNKVDMLFREGRTFFVPSIVLNINGWLCGTQFTFDPSSKKMEKQNFHGGFEDAGYSVFAFMNEKQELFGSLYQKVNGELETGIMLQLPYGNHPQTSFEYAASYNVTSSVKFQAKVSTRNQLAVALVKDFGNGISISTSGNLDAKNLKQGAHKVGLGIEILA